jgi:hypothetical protein
MSEVMKRREPLGTAEMEGLLDELAAYRKAPAPTK